MVALGIVGANLWKSDLNQPTTWQKAARPGPLSAAHAFMGNDCAACHTAGRGPDPAKCIACHANDEALLKRQPTAFHAQISSCKECHQEHQGGDKPPLKMDHEVLARLGVKKDKEKNQWSPQNIMQEAELWNYVKTVEAQLPKVNPHESALVSTLNCAACHSNQDKHRGFFGSNCLNCHTTQTWKIQGYRHPSPTSMACAQCHLAPPSHYMMHFQMISMKIAGKPHAHVNECYQCHQTTSWNDIQAVGWYKHH